MDNVAYRGYLQNDLFPEIREKCGEKWVFQQDSAPPHRAKDTVSYLKENTPDFISPDEWPVSSPDINPFDISHLEDLTGTSL